MLPICAAGHNIAPARRDNACVSLRMTDMQSPLDSFDAGTVIAAWLNPGTLGELEPILRRLLSGQQLFVKQSDGSYKPKGCQLGLARSFSLDELHLPALST